MIVRPIAGGVEVLAPAKLNLFLEVLGKRPDGYHEIETLMVAVDLHDTLTFADDPSGRIALRCDDPSLPTGAENLVVRAAERLQAEAGRPRGARDRAAQGDPGAGRAGRRVERRGGDAGGPGPALGPADPPGPAGRPGRRDRQRRGVLPARPGRRLPGPGRAGRAGRPAGGRSTSCWSARRSASSTAEVYRHLVAARAAPADRAGPGGLAGGDTGGPGPRACSTGSSPSPRPRPGPGAGPGGPGRASARRSTGT